MAYYKNFCISIVLLYSITAFAESRTALITGITGQDGSYLAEFLLEKGYEVHGLVRRSSTTNTQRIDHLLRRTSTSKPQITVHYGDVTDAHCITQLIRTIHPDEIYNLAAQSHVLVSFQMPSFTFDAVAKGALIILEAIRTLGLSDKIKFYQASSSEMFGKVQEIPQTETTPFYPRSPYGAAKLYAHWITVNYRESYGIFACSGILFNHESSRRGHEFVTRKITQSISRSYTGAPEVLYLGNLDAKRDWGSAKDYVRAMWLMLQQAVPDDYVIATGETHSVREFVTVAFQEIGIDIEWRGTGVEEKGYDAATGRLLVAVDPQFFRPAEVDILIGDPKKAYRQLGWEPEVTFRDLVREMMYDDIVYIRSLPR